MLQSLIASPYVSRFFNIDCNYAEWLEESNKTEVHHYWCAERPTKIHRVYMIVESSKSSYKFSTEGDNIEASGEVSSTKISTVIWKYSATSRTSSSDGFLRRASRLAI